MSNLSEALTSAKKEIESQGVRLRDLEALLTEERRAREDAEERANRLERESLKEREVPQTVQANGDMHKPEIAPEAEQKQIYEPENSSSPDSATARLQQRLETMMSEMNEMKQQMERYRERAETAEADRKSLAEMIENIRHDNAKKASKEAKRRSRSDSELAREAASSRLDGSEEADEAEEGEITIIKENDVDDDGASALLRRVGVQNGRPVDHAAAADPAKSSHALATRLPNRNELALAHGAPAVSILTVVALGVAVMAWLNQYPRVER